MSNINEAETKSQRIAGVPDKALEKAIGLATTPGAVQWVPAGKKFKTVATIGTLTLEADNNTALITAMANEILRLQSFAQSHD